MMKIDVLEQNGTEVVEERYDYPAEYDDAGNLIREAYTEVVTREVPVMVHVTRDMTAEEVSEALAQQAEWEEYERTRPRTTDERLDAYAEESDDAFFDLAEYAASLEEQLAALTARVTALEV